MDNYSEFLKTKMVPVVDSGFIPESLNDRLFPFQSFIVDRALRAGKYAIFADCGLGKTFMQLEWAHRVQERTGKPVALLAPLAVTGQTLDQAITFGIMAGRSVESPIHCLNYEQLHTINAGEYSGVVLDESSILKAFDGKTKQLLLDTFKDTAYKLCCTATPSPNDPMELGNHAEFLDVMGRNEMLAMYFVHDGGDTAKWRIKGHAVDSFYQWVGSWAIMLNKPQDIGFDMPGYNLPSLRLHNVKIETPKIDNGLLFNDAAVSATDFNAELRRTKHQRMEAAAKIARETDGQVIVWCKQNEEADLLRELLPEAVEVRGNDKPEIKEARLLGFGRGEFRILITKAKIAQFGLNYQNCNTQVFASLDFSFEGLYQAIRRSYRFGQKKPVDIHLITTDTMTNVIEAIDRKQKQFTEMQDQMAKAINVCLNGGPEMTQNEQPQVIETSQYSIKRGDCVQLIRDVPSESIGLSVFSPPFAELYTYSNHLEDMGNSKDYKEFLEQFGYLVSELYRVIMSGRNVAVHCMDLPIQKGKEGYIGLRDFSGMIRESFESVGFIYHSRITIWKDPVVEMQRTKALGLLHKQVKKDSTMSRVGIPDYVMVFRKDGDRSSPVQNTDLSVDLWQKYASPVWYDINYSNTLQGKRECREDNDEKHICPLQLETIERLIHLYSNPGDTILTPFMGIGSEVYQSIMMGRIGIGFELKESYFEQAYKNLQMAESKQSQGDLF
jgi:hypothetical protein